MPMDNDQQDPGRDAVVPTVQTGEPEAPAAHAPAEGDPVIHDDTAGEAQADAAKEAGDGVTDDPSRVMTVDAVLEATAPGAAQPLNEHLVVVIEAIVFASPEPITLKAIL